MQHQSPICQICNLFLALSVHWHLLRFTQLRWLLWHHPLQSHLRQRRQPPRLGLLWEWRTTTWRPQATSPHVGYQQEGSGNLINSLRGTKNIFIYSIAFWGRPRRPRPPDSLYLPRGLSRPPHTLPHLLSPCWPSQEFVI